MDTTAQLICFICFMLFIFGAPLTIARCAYGQWGFCFEDGEAS
jgi:hypothetical protein